MVNFAVFNELSLPFNNKINIEDKFIDFFKILKELNNKNLKKLRFDRDFKNYEILKNVLLQQFFGQIKNIELKDRLREFLTNSIIIIDSPLIKDSEIEGKKQINENDYIYNKTITIGGLASSHIWNTIAISFNSALKWNEALIKLEKQRILDDESIKSEAIEVKHISTLKHLELHKDFFIILEEENQLGINKKDFWVKKNKYFVNKIIFCKEVEDQIKKLNSLVFRQAISILRDLEKSRKVLFDFNISGEGKTVKNNPKLREQRIFTVDNEKVFFEKHIKNLLNGNRIYFLEKGDKIYIGYIGSHLLNKRDK